MKISILPRVMGFFAIVVLMIAVLSAPAAGHAAWYKPGSWGKTSAYSDAYARGVPPNSADAAVVFLPESDAGNLSDGSSMGLMPNRSKLRASQKLQNSQNGRLGLGAVVGRGWLWDRRPAPPANPAQQFSSYSAVYLEGSGTDYVPSQTFRPEDYLTDPPPGLVPTDDPVELWLSAGVGRFGDHEFELLGGTPSEPTPVGTFTVTHKDAKYWSKKFDAAMPYSVFFQPGYALHYGALDQPSHGCVHLPYETAQRLFYCTKAGKTKVIVHP